jgi:hypothetical protein
MEILKHIKLSHPSSSSEEHPSGPIRSKSSRDFRDDKENQRALRKFGTKEAECTSGLTDLSQQEKDYWQTLTEAHFNRQF